MNKGARIFLRLPHGGLPLMFLCLLESSGWAEIVKEREPLIAMASTSSQITLTEQDTERVISVDPGALIILRLEAVPGTGFGWQIVEGGFPELQLESSPAFEPKSQKEAGGAEDEVFRFRAKEKGRVNLELHYRRPWEKNVSPLKFFRIQVIIQ